jgi:magnesium transporter
MQSSESRHVKAGLPPGSLIHIGRKKVDFISISMIEYNIQELSSYKEITMETAKKGLDPNVVSWINVDGLHDIKMISKLGNLFEIHPLMLEDILNTKHRPKAEEFSNLLLLSFKMLGIGSHGSIVSEQVSLVLGESWVISFQEQQGDVFDTLRNSLDKKLGLARGKKADFLLYRLLDTIVDGYFYVVDHLTERIDKLESELSKGSTSGAEHRIQSIKKELIKLQRSVAPLREAVTTIRASSSNIVSKETKQYLSDVQEHVVQVLEYIANAKESINDLRELFLSNQNQRLNEVMKVLTIMSSIFIPMTFIAGIYGMNFQYMPELQWHYGYFGALGFMVVIPVVMLAYFKKKGWL